METSEINFCNGKGYNIKNNREKSDILKSIFDKYNLTIENDNTLTYSDRLLTNLSRFEYYVSTITLGNSYWLYLTKIGNQNYSIFIDNKLNENHKFPKLILVNFRFQEELFSDTLFKGELIKDYNNNWQFIIDNILVHNGSKIKNNILSDRIKLLYKIFEKNYIIDPYIELCKLKIKRYFTYDKLNYLVNKFINTCNYKISGIYFHPINTNIKNIKFLFNHNYNTINLVKDINFEYLKDNNSLLISQKNEEKLLMQFIQNDLNDNTTIKEKKINIIDKNNTFTFKVESTVFPNIYKLYCLKNNKLSKFSIAKIDTIECAEFMKDLFLEKKDIYLIECYYYKDFNKWVPKCKSNKPINSYIQIKQYINDFFN